MKLLVVLLLLVPGVWGMDVSFFEEFADEEMIEIVSRLPYEVKIYLAEEEVTEFIVWRDELLSTGKVKEVVWWPLLEEEDGYWFSPWSDSKAMERVFDDVIEHNLSSVMLDVEVPKRRGDIMRRSEDFDLNQELIESFIVNASSKGIGVYVIEVTHLSPAILEEIGLVYDLNLGQTPIRMHYSSFLLSWLPEWIVDSWYTREIETVLERDGILGIGLIAPGIYGNEPTYDADRLEKELEMAREADIEEVVIFRLGGVDEEVRSVLEQLS